MTPTPPYTAVIFTARFSGVDATAYEEAALEMVGLAAKQPGYLGVESASDAGGWEITVSYWESAAAARAWKRVREHLVVQQTARERWYSSYTIRVATVEHEYGFSA